MAIDRYDARHAVALAAALVAVPWGAAAEDAADAPPDWIPALTIGFDLSSQRGDGQMTNTLGPWVEPLTGTIDGGNPIRSPVIAFGGQLTGPALAERAGRPRPFAHAGYQHWTVSKTTIAKEGNPEDPFEFPPDTPEARPEDALGQGSQLSYRVDGSWWAGLGVDFTVPIGARHVQIKPSFDYFGESATVESLVKFVSGAQGDLANWQTVSLQGGDSLLFHAIGPRLAVETELVRRGPVALSMYAEMAFFWVIAGERTLQFTVTGDLDGNPVSSTADFRKDPMIGQGGVGLRLSWLGF